MAIKLRNLKMDDVITKVSEISRNGNLKSVMSSIGHGDGHVQGSGYYVTRNGKRYFIVTHDGPYGDNECDRYGYLLVMREDGEVVKPFDIKTPSGFNHPGSFQIVGDHLVLPTENYKSEGSYDGGCRVVIYDLTPLENNKEPTLCSPVLNISKDDKNSHRAGMLGATSNWLAIQDNSKLYLYRIDSLEGTNIEVTPYGSQKVRDFQGIGLVELNNENSENSESKFEAIFLVGLMSDSSGTTYKDQITLYHVSTDDESNTFVASEVPGFPKHVVTDTGNSAGGILSIHFRFGGGVNLYTNPAGEVHMTCLGTGRDFNDHKRFNFNEFSTESRIEVYCRKKPLDGQSGRASQNFSIKGFAEDLSHVRFKVYDSDGNEATGVSFNIYKDVPVLADERIYENVKNGDVRYDSEESPLYIHSPSPEGDGILKIVIEGTNAPHT